MKKSLILILISLFIANYNLSFSAPKKSKKSLKSETKTSNTTESKKDSVKKNETIKIDTVKKETVKKEPEKKETKGAGGLLDGLKGALDDLKKTSEGLTETDASNGIKEALIQGTKKGVNLVSAVDGFYKNPEIKIPLPKEAEAVESALRKIGMGKQVDEAVVSLNRAAEDASKSATDIFVGAITEMTISDAVNIVTGKDETAGTKYLQNKTTSKLTNSFSPIISKSLEKTNATKYWSDLMSAYNKIPFVKKVNPNLTEYVTSKAIDGLFKMVASEEKNIRKDPAARASDLLKKVFGSK